MVKITKYKDWRVQITKAKKFGRASLFSYLCTNENKTLRTAADGIEKGDTSMITQDMKDEAKKFGTTAEMGITN